MLHVRRSAAWLLLAAAVFGGTVAPAVHRAAHGVEREAMRAAHAADGHHAAAVGGAGETGAHLHETCTTRAQDDVACTLCQSVVAGIVAEDAARPDDAPGACPSAAPEARGHRRAVSAATGRGPPEGVA